LLVSATSYGYYPQILVGANATIWSKDRWNF
jgi:hypothetical protein